MISLGRNPQTTRYLILGSYLGSDSSSSLLTTRGMLQVTPAQISTALSLPLHLERPIAANSPISIAEPDLAVGRLIDDLISLLRSTGEILQQSGLPDLASFLAARTSLNDDEMIRQLAGAFPGFRDMYMLDQDHPVYLMKKALFLIEVLRHTSIRFPNLSSSRPILADNVLPVMLLRLGLIDTSRSTEEPLRKIDTSSQLPVVLPARSATILRAASVACCELLIKRIGQLTEPNNTLGEVDQDGLLRYLSNLSRDKYRTSALREEDSSILY